MSQTNWEADKMLDVYIYDYLKKRRLNATAKAFQDEAKVSTDPVAIDAPGGFLFEWWSVFWDIFIARTNEKHSDVAASYLEARELHQQKPQQLQQIQMQQQQQQQQFLMMRQQQRRDGTQLLNGDPNVFVGNDLRIRQNPATANALATKMYEERLKSPLQRDVYDDAVTKQRIGENASQLTDPNQSALLKAAAVGGQSPGHILHGTPGGISGNIRQGQIRNQQVPAVSVSAQEMKGGMMNPKATGSEGLLIGIPGTNQVSNNVTLKGWPLTGLDHLRSGLLQQPNSLMQSPQLQQQVLLQAQQNLASPVPDDFESRRLRMLLNSRSNMRFGKDGQFILAGDAPVQTGSPLLSHADSDMLIKSQQQQSQNNNQQQQYSQHARSSQHPQDSNNHLQQQDKMIGSGSITADGSVSNTLHGNDQPSKGQIGRKRKQPASSSGHANSSGTANTTGPSHSSPSTASTHTPGDAMSMQTLPHNAGSSKSMLMYSSDGLGPLATASNQLAEIDGFVDDGSLDDNVESYLSHDDVEPRDRVNRFADVKKGFTFSEVRHIPASTNKVECCHFSADGKLLATGAHDRKAVLWCTESFTAKSTLEEHSQRITDVRFSPTMLRLATSSADKTVRIWDVDNPGYSLRNFTGHSATVTSLDFHPSKEDLICSCDNNSEIRYWSIKNGSCAGVFKGGATHVRFQPGVGRILAAAAENFVSILDVETQVCRMKLQGHKGVVHSVCWDSSGEYLASVSNDLVKVWKFGPTSKGECINELSCSGNKFHTCAFHPAYPSLLVIGCYETLEIWNMAENQTMTVPAHDKLVSGLAVSNITGLIASSSHDKCVKLWK